MSHSPVSDRKTDANRQNALKSTGPRTEEGKARSSRNARKHGIFCKDLLVQGEDPAALAEFKREMLRSLNPRTCGELQLVEQIIADEWRIKRVRSAEQAMYARKASADPAQIGADFKARDYWERTIAYVDANYGPGKKPMAEMSRLWQASYRVAREGLAKFPDPTAATTGMLLDRLLTGGEELERLSKYEQRLRNSAFRAMKELRELQSQKPREQSELVDDLLSAEEEMNEKNEPTVNASNGEQEGCEQMKPDKPDTPEALPAIRNIDCPPPPSAEVPKAENPNA